MEKHVDSRKDPRSGEWKELHLSSEQGPIDLRQHQIGKFKLDLHIFDREPKILSLGVDDKKGLKDYLDINGGIRVYRDGVRVFDYGEPGNDWLGLDVKRVNVPTKRISNNLVLGAVSLSLDDSKDLIEKTNREGFVETDATEAFREAVRFAVQQVVNERNIDKDRIRKAYSKARQHEPVLHDLELLRDKLKGQAIYDAVSEHIDNIEKEFISVRDHLLTAASAGLSLAVVIHEVEKGIDELRKAVERETPSDRIVSLAKHLSELIEGLTFLTRKSGQKVEKASVLIRQAIFNTEYRMKHHDIKVVNGLEAGDEDFEIKCTRRLIIATLMNLFDNSIWWLDAKGGKDKKVFIGTSSDFSRGPAIVIADNGPGFQDPPEYLVEPFMTRKPDGMGLGLHVANEVMKVHGGRLEFPEVGDIELPRVFDGAVVALVFGAKK